MLMGVSDSCRPRDKVKQVIKLVVGKGSYRPDDEFLVDWSLAFPNTVDLANRYSHSLCQLREVLVTIITEVKNPCLYYHGYITYMTVGYIITTNMPLVKRCRYDNLS